MTLTKQVNRLNDKFGAAFGTCPLGPRYKWVHTSEMFYWIQDQDYDGRTFDGLDIPDHKHKPDSEGGVFVVTARYKRCSWADLKGRIWILAKWNPPIAEEEWRKMYGPTVPWPRLGEYQLIENVTLPEGHDPTESLEGKDPTEYAIWCIRQNLAKDYQQHLEEGEAMVKEFLRSTTSDIETELDDAMTAFGKVPGRRGGDVSLPLTKQDR